MSRPYHDSRAALLVFAVSTMGILSACASSREPAIALTAPTSPSSVSMSSAFRKYVAIRAKLDAATVKKSDPSGTIPDVYVAFVDSAKGIVRDLTKEWTESLHAADARKNAQQYQSSLDHAKLVNILLSSASTAVGAIGAAQTNNKGTWIGVTAILGAGVTVAVALRDDKDTVARLTACEAIAGGVADVTAFEQRWNTKFAVPPTTDADLKKMQDDLLSDEAATEGKVADLGSKCI